MPLVAAVRRLIAPFAVGLIFTQQAAAYEFPLSPASLHAAFVLGQRNDKATAEFLAPYLKQDMQQSDDATHIAEVEMLTPFVQVVDDSRATASGLTEQQAIQDAKERGNIITVRILIMLPSAYPKKESGNNAAQATKDQKAALKPENFWQNFHFNVIQGGKTLPTRTIRSKPIYSAATKESPSVLDGATVWLDYDTKDVASEDTDVEIVTPDEKRIRVTYDLKRLR